MDELPDKTIAEAIAASPAMPDRDTSFAARIENAAQRRHRERALIQQVVAGLFLFAGGCLATLAYNLLTDSLATLGASSPIATALLATLGAFVAFLFAEIAQFVLDRPPPRPLLTSSRFFPNWDS